MIPAICLIAIGLTTLLLGGKLPVCSASRLAAAAGISPLVIGLTIVATGTNSYLRWNHKLLTCDGVHAGGKHQPSDN